MSAGSVGRNSGRHGRGGLSLLFDIWGVSWEALNIWAFLYFPAKAWPRVIADGIVDQVAARGLPACLVFLPEWLTGFWRTFFFF